MPNTNDAQFGEPLFGEVEFGEQPAATLIEARSEITATASSWTVATSERRYS